MSNTTRLSEISQRRQERARSRRSGTAQPEIKPQAPTVNEGEQAIATIKALQRGAQFREPAPLILTDAQRDARIAHVMNVATSSAGSAAPQEPDPQVIANEARVIHAQQQAAGNRLYSFAEAVTEARTRRGLKPFAEVQKISMVGGE